MNVRKFLIFGTVEKQPIVVQQLVGDISSLALKTNRLLMNNRAAQNYFKEK